MLMSLIAAIAFGCGHAVSPSAGTAVRPSPAPQSGTDTSQITIKGALSPADIDAIVAAVRKVESNPILSIVQRPVGVEVDTQWVCGHLCGSGSLFTLRKIEKVWTIVDREEVLF